MIPMPFARGSMRPADLWRERNAVRAMRDEAPDILHVIAMKPILLSALAGAGDAKRVFALTGRGYFGLSRLRHLAPLISAGLRRAVRKGGGLLFENRADRAWVLGARALPEARIALMPGAGVDPARFPAQPEPEGPIVIGAASRLIWSKGLDLLVAALARLRAAGRDISLIIAGDADADNPEAVSPHMRAQWAEAPGVRLLGKVEDIAGFWGRAHIAAFPTRGGEGLPRSMLEAAASARAIVTTEAPGCADFVREAEAGFVVPPENVAALAEAIAALADDAALRQRCAAHARARVLEAYTETHAADVAATLWREVLAR